MRLLKKKIEKAQQMFLMKEDTQNRDSCGLEEETPSKEGYPNLPLSTPKTKISLNSNLKGISDLSFKNVAKNYGRAICAFIISHTATPYLEQFSQNLGIDIQKFREYIKGKKTSLNGMRYFLELFLVYDDDLYEIQNYKRVSQELGKIFMKYYSNEWILKSKLLYKNEYLKLSLKILRRIKHPEYFIEYK